MKKFLFAVAVTALFAVPATADNPPATAPAPVAITPTVVTTPVTTGTMMAPTTGTRRLGLFARLRAKNAGSTMMSAPSSYYTTGTTTVTPALVPMPSTTVPAPMPPIAKPTGDSTGAAVTGNPVVVTGGTTTGTVTTAGGVVTGGVMPAGGVVMANGMVVPASGTMMTDGTMMTSTMTTTKRMGLIARLRARR